MSTPTDSEILSWLEAGGPEGHDVFIDRDPQYFAVRLWPREGPGPEFTGPTLRSALVQAMNQYPLKATPQGCASAYGIIDPEYARIFTIARLLAWQEGYALAMHGSFTRDLDLVAVPWTEKAREPEHLVRRILAACEDTLREQHGNPVTKPHGRKVWTLIFSAFGDPRFVDLSIFPVPSPS